MVLCSNLSPVPCNRVKSQEGGGDKLPRDPYVLFVTVYYRTKVHISMKTKIFNEAEDRIFYRIKFKIGGQRSKIKTNLANP